MYNVRQCIMEVHVLIKTVQDDILLLLTSIMLITINVNSDHVDNIIIMW